MTYGFGKNVENFFKLIEEDEKKPLEDNCVFSITFINEKKKVKIGHTFSGKEMLGYCIMIIDKINKSLTDDAVIEIDVMSVGYPVNFPKICDFFELGIKMVNEPKTFFNDKNKKQLQEIFGMNNITLT
jgi:hypothetical protein